MRWDGNDSPNFTRSTTSPLNLTASTLPDRGLAPIVESKVPWICFATAHPGKFGSALDECRSYQPSVPPQLEGAWCCSLFFETSPMVEPPSSYAMHY